MTYATIDDLRESLAQPAHRSPEYAAKMIHPVPDAEVVDRARFILERVRGRVVLDVGASGPMHDKVVQAASRCHGIDREEASGVVGFDLDDTGPVQVPHFDEVEVVLCGEVLEHLSNPGWLLTRLRRQYPVSTIVTVPNAHSKAGRQHIEVGEENVNVGHTAWYSWHTLKVLVERAGYAVKDFKWYNGEPYTAEGIIFVLEPKGVS